MFLTLSCLDVLYLQTEYLILNFSRVLNKVNIKRFPTSRISKCYVNKNLDKNVNTLKLVYVGRLSKNKGVLDVCTLIKNYKNIQFHIYGTLCDDIRESDFNDFSNVFYHGYVENNKVQDVLINYHVFIMLSYHPGEGLSGSVIEAMMSGLPLILSDWKSLPEFISDNGFLLNLKNLDFFHDVISNYFDHTFWKMHSLNSTNLSKNYDFYTVKNIIEEDLV